MFTDSPIRTNFDSIIESKSDEVFGPWWDEYEKKITRSKRKSLTLHLKRKAFRSNNKYKKKKIFINFCEDQRTGNRIENVDGILLMEDNACYFIVDKNYPKRISTLINHDGNQRIMVWYKYGEDNYKYSIKLK